MSAAKSPCDRPGQPNQPVHVDLIHPDQVHQHVGPYPPVHPTVVRQGHVAHHAAVGVGPRREPQEHDYDSITTALPTQGTSLKSCYYTFGPLGRFFALHRPVTSTNPEPIMLTCLRTAELGFEGAVALPDDRRVKPKFGTRITTRGRVR